MDGGGFEEWYASAWPRLVGALTATTGDGELARDAAAEACARAYERWSSLDSPSGWTYTVASNVARRRGRRAAIEARLLRGRRAEVAPPPGLPSPVWDAVRSLPSRQRSAVALRYVLDLPSTEVAKVMGVTTGTVAASLHAARARLATLLTADDESAESLHG